MSSTIDRFQSCTMMMMRRRTIINDMIQEKWAIVHTSDVNLGDFLLSRDNQILKYTVSR